MAKIYRYKGVEPQIGKNSFLSSGVEIIGDVTLGDNCSIWFNSVLRGDVGSITLGDNVNIQDLCMLHNTAGIPLVIEENVSVGHHVMIHSSTIKKGTLVGMGSIIMDEVVVGESSLVAAGSVLPPRKVYPPGHLIMGNPARAVRKLDEKELNMVENHYKRYLKYQESYNDEDFTLIKETNRT